MNAEGELVGQGAWTESLRPALVQACPFKIIEQPSTRAPSVPTLLGPLRPARSWIGFGRHPTQNMAPGPSAPSPRPRISRVGIPPLLGAFFKSSVLTGAAAGRMLA